MRKTVLPRDPAGARSQESGGGRLDAPPAIALPTISLTTLTALAAIVVVRYAGDVFIPVVLGVFLSYALEPIVAWIARWRVPRAAAAAAVLLALLAALGSGVYALSDDLMRLADDIPPAAARLRETIRGNHEQGGGPLERVQKAATEIERSAAEATGRGSTPPGFTRVQVEEKPFNVRGYLWTGSMGILGLLGQAVLLVFLLYFLLVSGDMFKRKVVRLAGVSFARRRITVEVLDEIGKQVQRYFFVVMLTNALVAVASWLAFRTLGLERAAIWGLAAGLFHSIPYVGPLIVSVGVALVGFLQFGSLAKAAYLGLAELLITGIVGFLVVPWLVGKTARMNEVAVFVGLLFWAWMWGVAGMLLAVPMLVVVKAVCDRVEDLKPVGELLGD
jgi:predicted PurR-regulated permease PerM